MPDLSADPHRPIYHFLPPNNWMNDPNGPIFYEGRHHLMYQYAADVSDGWGVKYWGHAVSDDLVHWEHLPIALSPDAAAGDQGGCWSGSAALDDDGTPTILYTGVHPQVQCIARSRDGMRTWDKPVGNPVIAEPPEGISPKNFRDPCLWREDDGWYMVIGSGIEGVGGRALLYRSRDLMAWEYLHPLCEGDATDSDDMWECPDFFALGARHVLLVSALGEQLYFIGAYDRATHRFEPESVGRIGGGVCYYAAKSFVDGAERRVLWGWLRERRDRDRQIAAGWSGAMSLPQVLTMLPSGSLGIEPAPEVETLRGEALVDDPESDLGGICGDALEIDFEVTMASDAAVELGVRCTPDGCEEVTVRYDGTVGAVELDMTRSSMEGGMARVVHARPLALAAGEVLGLRVFVDRSVIEVYANGRECLVGRVYPTRSDAAGLRIRTGGNAAINRLRVWEMRSIW